MGTFMNYKGQCEVLAPKIIKVALGQETNANVGEAIRKAMVFGMRQGENLCYDIEQTTPDWTAFAQEGTFDP